MNGPTLLNRNRATLKLLFVGAISLAMLIPLLMVRSIIDERQNMQLTAEATIDSRWGGNQVVGGLLALTPAVVKFEVDGKEKTRQEWRANVLPELEIDADMETEYRYLGIYEVPVYTANVRLKGRLDWAKLDALKPEGDLDFWLPLGDVRGVRDTSVLRIGSLEIPARPLSLGNQNNVGLQFTLPAETRAAAGDEYSLELRLAGSQCLLFLPLADSTRVTLQTDWPHPEFIGQFLPEQRAVSNDGAEANWRLLGLNRPYGDQWALESMSGFDLGQAGFGMRLETPVDAYQRSERSVKYGFLFIALTFFTLFLFEVMTGRPLHPVPYVLTGAALAVFYLVLLALSEYISFGASFITAASLLVLIVTPYTAAVLGGRKRGVLVGAMMTLTYALLYALVVAQHASLLLGSLALLLAIACLMYLTRGVDWYAYGDLSNPPDDHERFPDGRPVPEPIQ